MKMLRLCSAFLFTLLFFMPTQAAKLGWGTSVSFSKDTLAYGDTLIISTTLVNKDVVAYQDSATLGFKINNILNVNPNIIQYSFKGQMLNLQPGGSVPVTIKAIITPAYYLVGPDILVIWPISKSKDPAEDTIVKQIVVVLPGQGTGIGDNESALRLFYNNQRIHLQGEMADGQQSHVKVYDINGRVVSEFKLPGNNSEPFEGHPQGLYIAEMFYGDGQRRMLKFIKTE